MGAKRLLLAVLTCSVTAMLLTGCGSTGGTTTVTEKQTTTVIREVPDDPAGEERAGAEQESVTDRDAGSGETDTSEGSIKVPDVVGKDHQLAQDTMQSAGLYNLSEEDATGQGRFMLVDRNWVVVEQSPRAGSRVAEDATIVLRSKKVGE